MRIVRRLATAIVALGVVMSVAPMSSAITGGTADGGGHPSVGMLLFYAQEGDTALRYRCSGTLVSPTVVLTAAHCTEGVIGKVLVTFSTTIAEQSPSGLPRASDDPDGAGSIIGFTPDEADGPFDMVYGTAHVHPDYSGFTDMKNWNDVGVVELSEPVSNLVPVQLAPVNYLATYGQPALNKTLFTFVGYGTEVRKPDSGPQKPEPMSYPLIRRVTDAQGQKLTAQILQVNGNPSNVIGGGGTCFGDSGGPAFLNDYQVTVTSYGYTSNCRYIDGHQRVDIPIVQAWLATYGVYPAAQ